MNNGTGIIFDGNHQPESSGDVERMVQEIGKLGGMLTFTIKHSEDGWTAQCNQVPGIVTGGTNPTPTNAEVEGQIRDAIHTAFNVKTYFPAQQQLLTSSLTLSLAAA